MDGSTARRGHLLRRRRHRRGHHARVPELRVRACRCRCSSSAATTASPPTPRSRCGSRRATRSGSGPAGYGIASATRWTATMSSRSTRRPSEAVAHMRAGKGPYFLEAAVLPGARPRRLRDRRDEELRLPLEGRRRGRRWRRIPSRRPPSKMIADGICTQADVDEWTAATVRELEEVVVAAKASPFPRRRSNCLSAPTRRARRMRRLKYNQAISEATVQCMQSDPNVFVAGIGVKDPGGMFGTTEEANELFPDRVSSTSRTARTPSPGSRSARRRSASARWSSTPGTTSCSWRRTSSSTWPPSGSTCTRTAPACRSSRGR